MEYITIIYNSVKGKYYKDGKELGEYLTYECEKEKEDEKATRKRIKEYLEQT